METTITINRDEVTTKKVEIALPYYSKSCCYNYKVIDEKTAIVVSMNEFEGNYSIGIENASYGLKPELQISDEKEFNEAYGKALLEITSRYQNNL